MTGGLPSPGSGKNWDRLSEDERLFFCFQDDSLPLSPNHAARIFRLNREDAERVWAWRESLFPRDWPDGKEFFRYERFLRLESTDWNDETGGTRVRNWLFECGIPFERDVFLVYGHDLVVEVTWKILVLYWPAFAWSVGVGMVVLDRTGQWACGFHHENFIVFGSHCTDAS
jgi:hypothetical protein